MSSTYVYDTKATIINSQIKALEVDFIRKVNKDITSKVTPFYNTFLLISAAFFAYFTVIQNPQCFARHTEVSAAERENADDITNQFYLLSNAGLVIHLLLAMVYYLQGRDGMFELMRPYVILSNLLTLGWFVSL